MTGWIGFYNRNGDRLAAVEFKRLSFAEAKEQAFKAAARMGGWNTCAIFESSGYLRWEFDSSFREFDYGPGEV